jgi:LPPG:FO 2-phospho-L-lactate transferase
MTKAAAQRWSSVVALAGGVGGARLVDGLDRVLPEGALSIVVNTGDDFEHWGLRISPDLDTIMYTLAGMAPIERGWGIEGDSFEVFEETKKRGGDCWFQLGDRDLVTHLHRTQALRAGQSLTRVTRELCEQLGVTRAILPMSDEPSPTKVTTQDHRTLAFQDWLVKERAVAPVAAISLGNPALPSPEVIETLKQAELLVLCPSNPYVSIDPILRLEGLKQAIGSTPIVAVSPIVGRQAVKGPLASMIPALEGREASSRAIAEHYGELVSGMIVHPGDAFEASFPILETNILLGDIKARTVLATELLKFSRVLR